MLAEQIGAHAKWVGFFDLQQIDDLVKGVLFLRCGLAWKKNITGS